MSPTEQIAKDKRPDNRVFVPRPVSRQEIMNFIGCPTCGASAGEPCAQKNNRNHHDRMHDAHVSWQKMFGKDILTKTQHEYDLIEPP